MEWSFCLTNHCLYSYASRHKAPVFHETSGWIAGNKGGFCDDRAFVRKYKILCVPAAQREKKQVSRRAAGLLYTKKIIF